MEKKFSGVLKPIAKDPLPEIACGDIYKMALGCGLKSRGMLRPVLVIQDEKKAVERDFLLVVPLSGNRRTRNLYFSIFIQNGAVASLKNDYVALLFQARNVPKEWFKPENYLGRIDQKMLLKVNRSLKVSFGLSAWPYNPGRGIG